MGSKNMKKEEKEISRLLESTYSKNATEKIMKLYDP